MDDTNYPTPDGVDETTASKDTSQSSPDSGEESMEGETFLAPKSVLGDYKVGDTCTFKIVHMYDDEAELAPVNDKDEDKPGSDNETMAGAQDKLDSMATESM